MRTPFSPAYVSCLKQAIKFMLIFSFVTASSSKQIYEKVKIGAIIDANSTIGKVQKVAMKLAAKRFNVYSKTQHLSLTFSNPQTDLPSSYAESAEELVHKNNVNVIVGMNQWEEAAAVADIGSRFKVPILSFSTHSVEPQFDTARWPYLVRMAGDEMENMKCIAAILRSYNWTRIVPIYEDNKYGGDSGKLSLLQSTIHGDSVEIEYSLVIPPLSEYSDSKTIVRKSLEKLVDIESRVFIVLEMSMPTVAHLVTEAKKMGFMQPNCVWIFADRVANFLDLFNTSIIYSMEGAVGTKNYYSIKSSSYLKFEKQFLQMLRDEYSDEEVSEPGFHALRAYDSITTISAAIQKLSGMAEDSRMLLNTILASNFNGLSGQIRFLEGRLSNDSLRIINVVGKRYREIDFWLPNYGFSKIPIRPEGDHDPEHIKGSVVWPGDSKKIPIGWIPPTGERKMIIGVPGRTLFNKFVQVVDRGQNKYSGFCIELFEMVKTKLDYPLDYEFIAYNGSYDDLVHHVYNKTFDAIVGDFTVLSKRLDKVDFSPTYMESSLSMVVRAVPEVSTWIIFRPFTLGMWLVSALLLAYTMLTVWLLERHQSPDFAGSRWNQIGAAAMFTLSTLFFVQREKLYNRLTRVVIIIWLFVVLILTSCYTASLSSMLTVRQLRPSVSDIEWLSENNKKVGCDSDSFLYAYLIDTHKFKAENIVNITDERDYIKKLQNGNILAAFFELPYEKAFFNEYCASEFISKTYNYRFGGLAFAFGKGSRIGYDVSKVMLDLMEGGQVKEMADRWFTAACSTGDEGDAKLGIESFIALYAISGFVSTACMAVFVIHRAMEYKKRIVSSVVEESRSSVGRRTRQVINLIFLKGANPESRWLALETNQPEESTVGLGPATEESQRMEIELMEENLK